MCLIFKEKLVSNLYYKKIQGNKRFFKFYKSSKFYVIGKFVSYVKRQVSEKRFLILRKFLFNLPVFEHKKKNGKTSTKILKKSSFKGLGEKSQKKVKRMFKPSIFV